MTKTILGVLAALLLATGVIYLAAPGLIVQTGLFALRWYLSLERREIEVDDHQWVYLTGGKGETVLFVHGFGADKDSWGTFPKAFRGSYRLVLPDLPGFGESSRSLSASYDMRSQARRLDRFVETVGLKRFHLVGASMGGYIAAYYAGDHPEKVESLTLMDPAGVEADIASEMWQRYRRDGSIVLLYETREEFEAFLSLVFHRPPWIPPRFRDYFAQKGAANHDFFEKILKDMDRAGLNLLEGRFGTIQARTLILWGAEDAILHVSGAEKFKKGIRDSRVVILDRCGHVPHFEKSGETTRILMNFLEEPKGLR